MHARMPISIGSGLQGVHALLALMERGARPALTEPAQEGGDSFGRDRFQVPVAFWLHAACTARKQDLGVTRGSVRRRLLDGPQRSPNRNFERHSLCIPPPHRLGARVDCRHHPVVERVTRNVLDRLSR
jgi:hypothetical protein